MVWKNPFPYLSFIMHLVRWACLALNISCVPKRRVLPTAKELQEREKFTSCLPGLSPCYQLLQQEVLVTGLYCPRQGYPTRGARSKAHRNQQLQQCNLNSGEVDGSGLKLGHAPPGLLPGSGAKLLLCGHISAHSGCSRKPRDAQTHVSSDCYGPKGTPATPIGELVSCSCGALDSLELWQKGKKKTTTPNRSRKTASPSIKVATKISNW